MEWNRLPEKNDMIKILQEQGQSNFNPLTLKESYDTNTCSKKIGKKAQRIIEENIMKQEASVKRQDELMYNSLNENLYKLDIKQIYNLLLNFRTNYYQVKFLLSVLDKLVSVGKITEKLYHVYYSLQFKTIPDDLQVLFKSTLSELEEKFKKLDILKLQMTKLSCFLYPLDVFNTEKMKLDEWQLDVINKIDRRENILIVARTSSGKTVCSTYACFVFTKVLFVVPSDELARQVAGILRNLLKGYVALVTNKDYFVENESYKVLVGTPRKLEEYVCCNGVSQFDYAVFDEVHQVRDIEHEGDSFEKLIMLVKCKVLMMSATLGNHTKLVSWFEKIKGQKLNVVEYTKRFINQQRYHWTSSGLQKLHPMSSLEEVDFKEKKVSINFTAQDLYDLYNRSKLLNLSFTKSIEPSSFFHKNIICNQDIKEFEEHIIRTLYDVYVSSKDELLKLLNSYNLTSEPVEINLLEILKHFYKEGMFPVIIFKKDSKDCIEEFKAILETLERAEEKKYPFYREDLEVKNTFFKQQEEEIRKLDDITNLPSGYSSFSEYKYDLENKIKNEYLNKMKEKFKTLYDSRAKKQVDTRALKIELEEIMKIESLCSVDLYRPHPEFTFTTTIDSVKMRRIKNRLLKTLDDKITYDSSFLRGIERGIVLYHAHLQPSFQREIQSLINQREIDFIIADDSLAYGVNMPIKTVLLLGDRKRVEEWDVIKSVQMSGRCGRRGIDREGNVCFANVNWKPIMKNVSMNITGVYKPTYIEALPLFFDSKFTESNLQDLSNVTIKESIEDEVDFVNTQSRLTENKVIASCISLPKLFWSCRYLNDKVDTLESLYKELHTLNTVDEILSACLVFLKDTSNLNNIKLSIAQNKLVEIDDRSVVILKLVGNILIEVVKNTNKCLVKNRLRDIFEKIKKIINKYQLQ